jgi:hypothetical protein
MNIRAIAVALLLLNSSVLADDVTPWFGSEASAPEQVSLSDTPDQLIDLSRLSTNAVSSSDAKDCPVEGCPLPANSDKVTN